MADTGSVTAQARSSVLSDIRSLHRENALNRKAARERLARPSSSEDRRARDEEHLGFTLEYERQLNVALHAIEEAFAESSVQDRGEGQVGEAETPVVRLGG